MLVALHDPLTIMKRKPLRLPNAQRLFFVFFVFRFGRSISGPSITFMTLERPTRLQPSV
jgi:hypothetical protein